MTAISTPEDVVKAAASIARDAAEGRLDPAQLDTALAVACREQLGTVAGPDDPLWTLQVGIARGVLAAGGVPTDELLEWAAVQRRRETPDAASDFTAVDGHGGTEPPAGADVVTEADSAALEPHSAENDAVPADADAEAGELAADTAPAPEAATGCGCAAHTAERGPRFGGTVVARGCGLPGQ